MGDQFMSQREKRIVEEMWRILENVIMGYIPEHLKSCLSRAGFTSIGMIGQIVEEDIVKFEELISIDPCNGVAFLSWADKKILRFLPALVQERQNIIWNKWEEFLARERCDSVEPSVKMEPLALPMEDIEPPESPEAPNPIFIKVSPEPSTSSMFEKCEKVEEKPIVLSPAQLRDEENELRRRLNRICRNYGHPSMVVSEVYVNVAHGKITGSCICPECNTRQAIYTVGRRGKIAYILSNFRRHMTRCRNFKLKLPEK